jgi:superfamily I DNA and RNA helicase
LYDDKFFGESALYHEFPIYPDTETNKSIRVNILFVSKNLGVFVFKCLEYSSRGEFFNKEDITEVENIDRLIFAKILKDAPKLQKDRRTLKINLVPSIYIHNCDKKIDDSFIKDLTIIYNEKELIDFFKGNSNKQFLSDDEFKDLIATIEGSKGIATVNKRIIKSEKDLPLSKGAILSMIESDIYNFDLEQKRAALFTLDGPQRIRGLAGSGKTVILAMKAAIIHLQNPDAEILYTYYTKSLNSFVKNLITRFYRQFSEKDPDWDRIHILHAWGGVGLEGVYYNACKFNGIVPLTLLEAKKEGARNPFEYVCEKLNNVSLKSQYDYVLMDEAQDFPASFYRLCRQITKNNMVVWAYDDFQNILNTKIQDEKETFGKDQNSEWYIDFSRKEDDFQDIVLHKCYRNPRKILIAAFSLGLGIYNKGSKDVTKVLQRLESNDHWESLGFTVESGNSTPGDKMIVSRREENSPLLKNTHLNGEIVNAYVYKTDQEEIQAVTKMIVEDIKNELNPEDISVICMDDRNVKHYFYWLSTYLTENKIKSFNLSEAPYNNITYKLKDHVTLSTIYKAKGNEAGSIYIIGVDSIFNNKFDIVERNKLFTAMTRAHGWVTITGSGKSALYCLSELRELIKHEFKLYFIQPSEESVKTIRQGISKKQAALNKIERYADQLSLELGIEKDEIIKDLIEKTFPRKK